MKSVESTRTTAHSFRQEKEEIDSITDAESARERIHELFEKGERPVISIPQQYSDALNKGLVAHASWIPGFSAIVGTLGREPYMPAGEDRILVKIDIDNEEQIDPRFTGPSHSYQGIVMLHGPIPAENIIRLDN